MAAAERVEVELGFESGGLLRLLVPTAEAAELVRAFVASTGGDQASYRGVLPPQMFPQWTLATASKALNNQPQVRAETRAKVIQAAEALSFSPNTLAQGLITHEGRSDTA